MTDLMTPLSIEKALRRMAWGFVFLIFDFNINNIDILNNKLGYILILYSLYKLEKENSSFRIVKWLTFILFINSFVSGWFPSVSLFEWNPETSLSSMLYGLVSSLINLFMMVMLFRSIEQLAIWSELKDHVLEESLHSRKKALLGVMLIQQLLYPFLMNIDENWASILFVFVIIYVFLLFLFIRILFRLANAYHLRSEQNLSIADEQD